MTAKTPAIGYHDYGRAIYAADWKSAPYRIIRPLGEGGMA